MLDSPTSQLQSTAFPRIISQNTLHGQSNRSCSNDRKISEQSHCNQSQ